jgi:hypothetical protein
MGIASKENFVEYTKPEVVLLGRAYFAIKQLVKGHGTVLEFGDPRAPKMTPAYDLDD